LVESATIRDQTLPQLFHDSVVASQFIKKSSSVLIGCRHAMALRETVRLQKDRCPICKPPFKAAKDF
jgi:hypothetical protein